MGRQLLVRRRPRGRDGRQDPAARRQDLEVARPALAEPELRRPRAREQEVGVGVDETRRDGPAVRVEPGDYVVADRDGIVVIPAAMLDEVLERAEEVVATENEIRTAVRNGVAPLDAYDQYGIF